MITCPVICRSVYASSLAQLYDSYQCTSRKSTPLPFGGQLCKQKSKQKSNCEGRVLCSTRGAYYLAHIDSTSIFISPRQSQPTVPAISHSSISPQFVSTTICIEGPHYPERNFEN